MLEIIEGKRWFIWTLVIIVVSGIALATLITYVSLDDNSADGNWLVPQSKIEIKK